MGFGCERTATNKTPVTDPEAAQARKQRLRPRIPWLHQRGPAAGRRENQPRTADGEGWAVWLSGFGERGGGGLQTGTPTTGPNGFRVP